MKMLLASVFALGLLGASALPASALTIHVGGGHHGHRHCTSWGHHHHCRGWGW
ncbi:MAG TPA: hypothetical protein VNU97_04525 [Rhizomicrobium sp.]|jgi:hypothetical protein|nr:hypothetical protein [Rhizomicrobium sp.]